MQQLYSLNEAEKWKGAIQKLKCLVVKPLSPPLYLGQIVETTKHKQQYRLE